MSKLEKYTSYKESGVEWLGKIPEDWEVKKLKFVLKMNNGQDYKNVISDEGYPVIGSGGQFAFANQYLYDGEVLLLGRKGTIDKPLYFKGKFWTVDTMFYGISKQNSNTKFLYYSSLSIPFQFYSTSTALPSMTQFDLNNHKISFPPKHEQTKIASFLDEKTTKIDEAISQKEKLIELLKERKQIVINEAVTKGLDKDVELIESGVEWIGKIPKHWKVSKLGTSLKPISIKNRADLPLLSVTREQGVILRDVDDKGSNHNFIPDDLSGYKMVEKGQFTMNKMKAWQGSYGISEYTGIVSPAYFIFQLKGIEPSFFHKAIRSSVYVPFFIKASDGVRIGQWDLSKSRMKEIPFYIPPIQLQLQIVEHIESEITKINNAIELQQNYITKLKEYKATLIDSVVTGKVRVA